MVLHREAEPVLAVPAHIHPVVHVDVLYMHHQVHRVPGLHLVGEDAGFDGIFHGRVGNRRPLQHHHVALPVEFVLQQHRLAAVVGVGGQPGSVRHRAQPVGIHRFTDDPQAQLLLPRPAAGDHEGSHDIGQSAGHQEVAGQVAGVVARDLRIPYLKGFAHLHLVGDRFRLVDKVALAGAEVKVLGAMGHLLAGQNGLSIVRHGNTALFRLVAVDVHRLHQAALRAVLVHLAHFDVKGGHGHVALVHDAQVHVLVIAGLDQRVLGDGGRHAHQALQVFSEAAIADARYGFILGFLLGDGGDEAFVGRSQLYAGGDHVIILFACLGLYMGLRQLELCHHKGVGHGVAGGVIGHGPNAPHHAVGIVDLRRGIPPIQVGRRTNVTQLKVIGMHRYVVIVLRHVQLHIAGLIHGFWWGAPDGVDVEPLQPVLGVAAVVGLPLHIEDGADHAALHRAGGHSEIRDVALRQRYSLFVFDVELMVVHFPVEILDDAIAIPAIRRLAQRHKGKYGIVYQVVIGWAQRAAHRAGHLGAAIAAPHAARDLAGRIGVQQVAYTGVAVPEGSLQDQALVVADAVGLNIEFIQIDRLVGLVALPYHIGISEGDVDFGTSVADAHLSRPAVAAVGVLNAQVVGKVSRSIGLEYERIEFRVIYHLVPGLGEAVLVKAARVEHRDEHQPFVAHHVKGIIVLRAVFLPAVLKPKVPTIPSVGAEHVLHGMNGVIALPLPAEAPVGLPVEALDPRQEEGIGMALNHQILHVVPCVGNPVQQDRHVGL